MRSSRRAIDTDTLAWQPLSDVMQCKLLNGKAEEGPHTLLLRSGPREPGPAFAQYHPHDEELFCLEGDFTFDGSTWLGERSYSFYPAYFVHGTKVHVRGGYVVYLRHSGASSMIKVDEPESDTPYYVGEGQCDDYALQLVDVTTAAGSNGIAGASSPEARPLHTEPATGKGSTLLTAGHGSVGQIIEMETTGLLELFGVSGAFALANGDRLKAHTYHCEVGDRPSLTLQCREAGSLLISHDGKLTVRAGIKNGPAWELGRQG